MSDTPHPYVEAIDRIRELESTVSELRKELAVVKAEARDESERKRYSDEENDALRVENERLTKDRDSLRLSLDRELAVRAMSVDRLGGTVEGQPTGTHNFLQRIDALREIEIATQRR